MTKPNFCDCDFLQEWINHRAANDLMLDFNMVDIDVGLEESDLQNHSYCVANDNEKEATMRQI